MEKDRVTKFLTQDATRYKINGCRDVNVSQLLQLLLEWKARALD